MGRWKVKPTVDKRQCDVLSDLHNADCKAYERDVQYEKERYRTLNEHTWMWDEKIEKLESEIQRLKDAPYSPTELEEDVLRLEKAYNEGISAITKLQSENQRLRDALGFYADKEKYNFKERYPKKQGTGTQFLYTEVTDDNGSIARQALDSTPPTPSLSDLQAAIDAGACPCCGSKKYSFVDAFNINHCESCRYNEGMEVSVWRNDFIMHNRQNYSNKDYAVKICDAFTRIKTLQAGESTPPQKEDERE